MPAYRLATPAKRDLVEVLEYLLENVGGRLALSVESRLRSAFQMLARHPGAGHKRADLTSKPALFLTVGQYVIVYRIDSGLVLIVAVLHGSRDVKAILEQRPF